MSNRTGNPIFVAFEGGDGAGKTTQARMLTARLPEEGRTTILVREPGATPLGDHLREYLKSNRRISPRAELLLFEAARAQLVEEVIKPSMEQGASVVSDRFAASSIAYQGYGREVSLERVRQINDFATQSLYPHLNIPAGSTAHRRAVAGTGRTGRGDETGGKKARRGRGELRTLRGRGDRLPPEGHGGLSGPGRRRPGQMGGDRRHDGSRTGGKAVWERVSELLR